LYGLEFTVYNVHLLTHICDDVEIYGSLDEYSSIPFESYLGYLKKWIRTSTNPLQQIHRRLHEINSFLLKFKEHNKNPDRAKYFVDMEYDPLLNNFCESCKQYKKITFPNLRFSINQHSRSNSYCMLRGDTKIIEIHNIIKTNKGDIFLIGKHFIEYLLLYLYPCHSSLLDIYVVKGLSDLKGLLILSAANALYYLILIYICLYLFL